MAAKTPKSISCADRNRRSVSPSTRVAWWIGLFWAVCLGFLGVREVSSQTPTPVLEWTATPTATVSFTDTDSPTQTLSPTATATQGTPTVTPTHTGTPTKTPLVARSGIALLSTAYSNRLDRTNKLNVDMLFSYYIGSIFETNRGQPVEYLNPLRNWLLTADTKYGFLEESGNRPGLAAGLITTLLLQGGNPGATGASSTGLKFTTKSLGGLYLVASKKVSTHSSVHLGYVRGGFRDLFKTGFLRKAMPSGGHADLLPLFAGGLEDVRNEHSRNLFYTGLDFRFLGTVWRFEFQKPFPLSKGPWLLNTKVDRLLSFNLSYEHWQGGQALLGYFNFRFTIIPTDRKKSKKNQETFSPGAAR